MTLLERLQSLGFSNAEITGSQPSSSEPGTKIVVRLRTSKGWVYEKFAPDDDAALTAWAARHSPE